MKKNTVLTITIIISVLMSAHSLETGNQNFQNITTSPVYCGRNEEAWSARKISLSLLVTFMALSNGFIIFVMIKQVRQYSLDSREMYIILLSLSAADFMMAVFSIPTLNATPFVPKSHSWCSGLSLLFTLALFSFHSISILTTSLFSICSYIAYVKCYQYQHIITKKRISITLVCIWVGSLTVHGISLLDPNILPASKDSVNPMRRSHVIAFEIIVFQSLVILILIHGHLYFAARSHLRREMMQQRSVSGHDVDPHDLRKRKFKMLVAAFAITGSYFVSFIPMAIILILQLKSGTKSAAINFFGPVSFLNPTIDPILYVITIKDLRRDTVKHCRKMFGWLLALRLCNDNRRRRVRPNIGDQTMSVPIPATFP